MSLALRALHQVMQLPARLDETLKRRLKFGACIATQGVCLHPESRIWNFKGDKRAISIGALSHIRGELLVFTHGGTIQIGDTCYIGEGSRIWSGASVTIGNRVLISHGVNIHDTNSHSLSAASRHDHFLRIISSGHPALVDDISAPIVIEDDAWLGFNATILKGVRIGRGAIVGAASVVTKDVAPYTVVAGNPAKSIGAARP